jgi:lipopolysaccharide/colanic/teichoic acid biosynthesis glycosyltransferase
MMKRLIDIVVATAILAVMIVPITFIILLVRYTSPGDGIFTHERIGRDGKKFNLYKFRTMVHQPGFTFAMMDQSTPLFKMVDDPRVTPVGRILRKYSIDEIPQLLNVIKGDMSLVGPRPQVAEEIALYDDTAHQRLSVRPGMTGLWQVSGRSDVTWDEGLALDLHYVNNHHLLMDLMILVATVKVVLIGKGAY